MAAALTAAAAAAGPLSAKDAPPAPAPSTPAATSPSAAPPTPAAPSPPAPAPTSPAPPAATAPVPVTSPPAATAPAKPAVSATRPAASGTSTWRPQSRLALLLLVTGALALPIISVTYLALRLRGRTAALVNFFTQEALIERYLLTRGRRPSRADGETQEDYLPRLRSAFQHVFSSELSQQYSLTNFVVPMFLAWFAAALAIFVLVRGVFGPPLPATIPADMLPRVMYALFGAFVWSLWMVIRAYTRNDLTPSTFYWVFFRHLLAVGYGALAGTIFTPTLADLGAFFAGTLPFSQIVRFFSTRLGTLGGLTHAEGAPKLTEIQGIDSNVIQRLDELEIHTAQDLAFSDPLELLLRSNFPVKVLVDWMDQAFLLNYVGDGMKELRPRGIRGAIEMASLYPAPVGDPRVTSAATALKLSEADLRNLINNLYQDNQLQLVWHLWGVFEA